MWRINDDPATERVRASVRDAGTKSLSGALKGTPPSTAKESGSTSRPLCTTLPNSVESILLCTRAVKEQMKQTR